MSMVRLRLLLHAQERSESTLGLYELNNLHGGKLLIDIGNANMHMSII